MITTFTPARATTAVLLQIGDLRANLLTGAAPAQYADLQDTVAAGTVPYAAVGDAESYVAPDAAVVVAAGYDELYVDVQPSVRNDGSVGVISPTTQNAFRQIALTDRPYWITVRCDGYGVLANGGATSLGTTMAQRAYGIASNVANWAAAQCTTLLMTPRLRGFAFVGADLNVRFTDLSVVDRLFQNRLVQLSWNLGRACSMITSRPADHTALVAPPFGTDTTHANTNSGLALQYPILGTNPAQRDRIVVLYPVTVPQGQQAGIVLAMIAGAIGLRGRDPGFPLNMDAAFVVPLDAAQYAADGVVGTSSPADTIAQSCAFAASLGITALGTTGGTTIVPAERFLPVDALVNTTGAFRASSTIGITTVEYADASGATVGIVRRFDAAMNEIVPPAAS